MHTAVGVGLAKAFVILDDPFWVFNLAVELQPHGFLDHGCHAIEAFLELEVGDRAAEIGIE